MLKIQNFAFLLGTCFMLILIPFAANAAENEESVVDALQVLSVVATDKQTINVSFNKELVLPENINDAFTIQDTEGNFLNFSYISILEDGLRVAIVTEPQVPFAEYSLTALSSITDTDGGPVLSGVSDGGVFLGSDLDFSQVAEEEVLETPELAEAVEEVHAAAPEDIVKEFVEEIQDTTAPEDVTNLRANYSLHPSRENSYDVGLKWEASENSEEDLDFQNYQYKKSKTDYSTAIRIDKDKTSYQSILEGGERYTFKISTVDDSGNMSAGAITSIILPATGPGALLGLIGIGSLLSSVVIRNRKKEE